jgi:hypothetical protein
VVADVEVDDEYYFERRWYGSNPEHLQLLSQWLVEQQVEEIVMEPRRNTGNRCGAHWNGTGNRAVKIGKVPAKCQAHFTWRRRCPIADGAGARKTFAMQNVS